MFLEHNDYYTRSGHTRVLYGPKLVEAPGEARSNFEVINDLMRRLGSDDVSMHMTDRDMVEATFRKSGLGELDEIEKTAFIDREQPEAARFVHGFAWPDGKFRFKPKWQEVADKKGYLWTCDPSEMPEFADWWDVNEPTNATTPFRLATSPSRSFLNSTFSETMGSQKRQPTPTVFVRPVDAAPLGIADGDRVILGNHRGEVALTAVYFEGLPPDVLIAESIHPNKAHANGNGINTLVGADPIKPFGGVAFHDTAVWMRKA